MTWCFGSLVFHRVMDGSGKVGRNTEAGVVGDGLSSSLVRQLMVGGTMYHLPRARPRMEGLEPRFG